MNGDLRQKTWELAQTDQEKALAFARKIGSDWNRCQSLAFVAWHVRPKKLFLTVVNEALGIARDMREPNRAVTCSAWPVRAMAERDDVELLPTILALVDTINQEPNPVRRADALLFLYEAVYFKHEVKPLVFSPLLAACTAMNSWKKPRMLQDIALILAVDDLPAAFRMIEMLSKESAKEKVRDYIEKSLWLGPHEFFPYYTKQV